MNLRPIYGHTPHTHGSWGWDEKCDIAFGNLKTNIEISILNVWIHAQLATFHLTRKAASDREIPSSSFKLTPSRPPASPLAPLVPISPLGPVDPGRP